MAEQFNPVDDLRTHLIKAGACAAHPELRRPESVEEAELWWETVQGCSPNARVEHLRWLGLNDLYFLLVFILHRRHLLGEEPQAAGQARKPRDTRKAQWCFARCREVQDDPDNHLDLWARETFKSEIITFGLNIQDILKNPNETIGIFSHNRPLAKGFLRLIKTEFQTNQEVKDLYPDVLWQNPEREAPKWSEDEGIVVKRSANRKESSFEAWGLVDGQPTGKRFTILDYDDVISRKEINTPEMIARTTREFENSLFLTASDPPRFRYTATFQEIGDTSEKLLERGVGTPRIRPAVDAEGRSLCHSEEKLAWFKQNLSAQVFALQLLLDTKAAQSDRHIGFDFEWLDYYNEVSVKSLNRYILVDPAGKGKESNSHFALWVVGVGADRVCRVLDMIWDNMTLIERGDAVFRMVAKWDPLKVAYEVYGMQADGEYLRDRMERETYRFNLVEVGGNQLSKDQRIELLIPEFRARRVLLPRAGIRYRMLSGRDKGREIDLVQVFIEREYKKWPFTEDKDLLDSLARLKDPVLNVVYPRRYGASQTEGYWGNSYGDQGGGWMSQ